MPRKIFSCTLMAAAMILSICSCGTSISSEDYTDEIRNYLTDCAAVSFVAGITADYGDRVYIFELGFEESSDESVITVRSPESIAGAAVRISDEGTTLEYDGARIYTGEIMPDGVSPVDALPIMLDAWRGGLIIGSVFEQYNGTDCVAVDYMITDDAELRTWFDIATSLPLHAELYYSGYTIIAAEFYDVKVV